MENNLLNNENNNNNNNDNNNNNNNDHHIYNKNFLKSKETTYSFLIKNRDEIIKSLSNEEYEEILD